MTLSPRLFILVLVLAAVGMAAQPRAPQPPVRPTLSPAAPSKAVTPSEAPELAQVKGQVRLRDGAVFTGKLGVPRGKLELVHKRDGQFFALALEWAEIHSLSFLKWKKSAEPEAADATCFRFSACEIRLVTKQDRAYTIVKPVPEFDRFALTSTDGQTTFYSYFLDFLVRGAWKNAKTATTATVEGKPNPRCIAEIIFLE